MGGVLVVLLWALVVYFKDYEIGWIAWAAGPLDFPAKMWEEAEHRWAAMAEEERWAFRDEVDVTVRRNIRVQLPMIRPALRESALRGSYGAMDLTFFGLAVVTAFGLTAGTRKTPDRLPGLLASLPGGSPA